MKKTKAAYKRYLNNLYSGEMSYHEAEDCLIYLTNPNRGKDNFIGKRRLQNAWHNYKLGNLLSKYDPIAFNVGYNEWVPK